MLLSWYNYSYMVVATYPTDDIHHWLNVSVTQWHRIIYTSEQIAIVFTVAALDNNCRYNEICQNIYAFIIIE